MNLALRLDELSLWYREALLSRASQLDALIPDLLEGEADPRTDARAVAHELRGSGGTFGYPQVTAAARAVEECGGDRLAPIVLGFADLVREVGNEGTVEIPSSYHGWLWHAAALPRRAAAPLLEGKIDVQGAWTLTREDLGMTADELADLVAEALGTERFSGADPSGTAARLVPSALVSDHRIVPVREDGRRIHIASAHPTALATWLEVERVTGRQVVPVVATPEEVSAASAGRAAPPDPGSAPVSLMSMGSGPEEETATEVLVVDDDESARVLAGAVLRKVGHVVHEAESADEGFQRLDEEPGITLVLLDLQMPEVDGREFLTRLRDGHPRGDVPVIVLTATRDEGTEADIIELGADDYLRKPIDPRLLVARLQATLRRVAAKRGRS